MKMQIIQPIGPRFPRQPRPRIQRFPPEPLDRELIFHNTHPKYSREENLAELRRRLFLMLLEEEDPSEENPTPTLPEE